MIGITVLSLSSLSFILRPVADFRLAKRVSLEKEKERERGNIKQNIKKKKKKLLNK